MKDILKIFKQRRIWAGIFAFIAFMLPIMGVNINIDATNLTDATMNLIESISGIMAIILPLLSYFNQKQK